MKRALGILMLLSAVLVLILIAETQAADFSWKDEFTYANLQEMQNAGWVLTNPGGTRLESGGVVLDGTNSDTVIRYRNHFPSGIYEWSVETKSMWTGVGHSGPGLNVYTEKHHYGVVADGWYNHFAFDRDGKIVTFGAYKEQANVWITMTITKKGNAVNVYCNGQLIYNYTEQDSGSYSLVAVERIAPWKGVMVYDYYQVAGPDVVSKPTTDSGGFPIFYIALGGGIAALIVVGGLIYTFFIASGSAAASTGALASGVGAAMAGTAITGVNALPSFFSNLVSESVSEIMTSLGYSSEALGGGGDVFDNSSTTSSIYQAISMAVRGAVSSACGYGVEPGAIGVGADGSSVTGGTGNSEINNLGSSLGVGAAPKVEVDVQVGSSPAQPSPSSAPSVMNYLKMELESVYI
ncbi:MAG: hypothetical protein QXZ70_07600 [Candidatus Bathyarchaeia archaeon]